MAKKGLKRPSRGSYLGQDLSGYIYKNCFSYDSKFDKKIRNLRPDWFPMNILEKKQEILFIAKNGENKPVYKKRGACLRKHLENYTHKDRCYDPEFDKQIRELRPDWFNNKEKK